jgi:arabinose-5-phosphate isomerase
MFAHHHLIEAHRYLPEGHMTMTNLSETHVSAPAIRTFAPQRSGALGANVSRQWMLDRARDVLKHEAGALQALANSLDEQISVLADIILASPGIVVVSGVGKSRLVGEKISATLASTGTRSITLDPLDALHGDLGRMAPGDVFLCLSNSGETAELKDLVRAVKRQPIMVALMTGSGASSLARAADIVLDIGAMPEACSLGLAPTTSTTVMMALGDALAVIIAEKRGLTRADFARFHPGGSLGRELMRVRDLMWPLESIPVLSSETPLAQALIAMCRSSKVSGIAVVLGARAKLVGILTGKTIENALRGDEASGLTARVAAYLQSPPGILRDDAPLQDAAHAFRLHGHDLMPVEDAAGRFVGILSRPEMLGENKSLARLV